MEPLSQFSLFTDVLVARARTHGLRTAVIYLEDGEEATRERSYLELDGAARRIGAWIAARVPKGSRVLLVVPAGLEVIEAFFGCLYAGATAVLAYPPRRRGNVDQLARIARDSGAEIVLSTEEVMSTLPVRCGKHPAFGECLWQQIEDISVSDSGWQPLPVDPGDIAFLQYTSGSTGDPKGVAVSHGNVIENQRSIHRIFRQKTDAVVMAGWLPLYHDMGLVGNLLHPIYLGGTLVFMPPLAFLQQPGRWLRMISKYRATISGGPNFAYELCLSRVPKEEQASLDLSSWGVAFNGAEPLRYETLARFQETFSAVGFAPAAFCPCYGMAETTLIVSGSVPGEPWQSLVADAHALRNHRLVAAGPDCRETTRMVSSGVVDEAFDVRIVDPDSLSPVAPGQVGEIWIAGPSVAQGYWGNETATRERFHAHLHGGQTGSAYLRTGDLGAIRDGQVYVTGRLKDLIIVNGVNYYPQDLERTAENAHHDLMAGSGAAFGADGDEGEKVHLAYEVSRNAWRSFDLDAIVSAVCRSVWEEHQLAIDRIVLIRPGGIPKTTSGKLKRRATREMCEDGSAPILATWDRTHGPTVAGAAPAGWSPTPREHGAVASAEHEIEGMRRWLQSRIAQLTGTPSSRIGFHQPLALYGMTSLAMVRMAAELSEKLQRQIPPTIAYDHPTIEALSRSLVRGEPQPHEKPTDQGRADKDEGIAVIGMACRFPGAESLADFDRLLREGRSAIGPMTEARARSSGDACGAFAMPGGYLQQIDRFDPLFFSISPREAEEMDPQQRLMLEVAWETFENAGLCMQKAAELRTGVFVGVSSGDYSRLMAHKRYPGGGHVAAGNSLAMIANRLSYLFNFRGPSLAIDTACSSSLVAVHYAAESIRRGECDLALVGGVSLMAAADAARALGDAGMLSRTGVSRAFAAEADGFVRGEGCGAVLLKRLSHAQRDGDQILAVLRGSAVNQDGRSNGLTAPNGLAQQAVIRTALESSGLEPRDIDFIEAHGTSTELGDPIEMHALMSVFAPRATPLFIASVKSNLGHLEGAAGIAGLMKTVLSLRMQQLPPHLNWDRPSEHITWQNGFEIPTRRTPWPATDSRVRRAGVSSFGFGGTNAHLIVEEAPASPPAGGPSAANEPRLDGAWLKLSAQTPEAIRSLAVRYVAALDAGPLMGCAVADIISAANRGRGDFACRWMIRAESRAALLQRLQSVGGAGGLSLAGRLQSGVLSGEATRGPRWTWYFACPDLRVDGARQADDLSRAFPSFRKIWQALQDAGPQVLSPRARAVTFQCAVAEWLKKLGMEPGAIRGTGYGQLAAAAVSGTIPFAEAFRLCDLVPAPENPGAWPAHLSDDDDGTTAPASLVFGGGPAAIPPSGRVVHALGTESDAVAGLWATIALAYCDGFHVDWELLVGRRRVVNGLPTYPFQRQSCWFRDGKGGPRPSPLLGTRIDVAGEASIYETDLSRFAELADHRLDGHGTLPASAYLELAVAAADALGHAPPEVRDLRLESLLQWDVGSPLRVQVAIRPSRSIDSPAAAHVCEISVRREAGWQRCAVCKLTAGASEEGGHAETESGVDRWPASGISEAAAGHYEKCRAAGLDYRGAFRCLESWHATELEVRAEVRLPEPVRQGSAESQPRYLCHPALLDGCIQSIAAIPALGPGLWLPVEVARYCLRGPVTATAVRVHAQLQAREAADQVACSIRISDQQGETLARIEGLRLRKVREAAAAGSMPLAGNAHWVESWEPRPRSKSYGDPPDVTAAELGRSLTEHRSRSALPNGSPVDGESRQCLQEISNTFAANAVCEMLGTVAVGTELSTETVFERGGVVPAKQSLCRRILQILANAGHLRPSPKGWVVQQRMAIRDALALCAQAIDMQPALAPEVRLLMRCGPYLSDVLRGDMDPLSLLFSNHASASAAEVYAHSAGAKVLNDFVAEAVEQLVKASSPGRALRILEVGGGTAATTRRVLDRVLAHGVDYTFTDIGPGFLATAAERFADVPAVHTQRLDIESDPVRQGLRHGAFDVVIAANVLHATANLERTVGNVRALLAPGGQLLLVEGTRPISWMDLTFGLTDGWWHFQDHDAAREYPLVSPERWRECLQSQGFDEVVTVAPGRDLPATAENVLCIARASRSDRVATSCAADPRRGLAFVVAINRTAGEAIRAALEGRGTRAEVFAAHASSRGDWPDRLASALDAEEPTHVILATATDTPTIVGSEGLPDSTNELIDSLCLALQAYLRARSSRRRDEAPALCLATSGGQRLPGDTVVLPDQAAAHALLRAMVLEHPDCPVRLLDAGVLEAGCWESVVEEILSDDPEREVALRGAQRYVRKLHQHPVWEGGPANRRLHIVQRGHVDGLEIRPNPREPLGPCEVEIEVQAAGLNFRDVLNVLGRYGEDVPLGAECSGVVSRIGSAVKSYAVGDRVLSITANCFSGFVTVAESHVLPLPQTIDMQAAAGLPVAYLTAAVALETFGQIQPGQRVLIHAATGGVGLAAVAIARARGTSIFASAGRAKHPHLFERGLTRVYDSRLRGFAAAILEDTAGAGVDLVLNTLDESFVEENLAVLSPGGMYVDITKPGTELLRYLQRERPDVRYRRFDLAKMIRESPVAMSRQLQEVIARVARGDLPLLPVESHPLQSHARALRKIYRAEHVGKVTIVPDRVPTGLARARPVAVREDGAYVIAGGSGDLGLLTARLLADRSAGLIALIVRRPPGPRQQAMIDSLVASGARIAVVNADIADRSQLARVLEDIRLKMPIVGVIHSAGVLADALIEEQSRATVRAVLDPKVRGAWNLHQLTLTDRLDSFVLYSSLASVLGAPGQANHAAANGFLDGLADYRMASGLPATCLNFGPWSDIGEAARRGVAARSDLRGIGMLTVAAGTEAIGLALQLSDMRIAVVPIEPSALPARLRDSGLFDHVCRQAEAGRSLTENLRRRLDTIPRSHQLEWLREQVTATLASVLGMQADRRISAVTAFTDLGLDSLTGIEFIDALNRQWGTAWPTSTVYERTTVDAIARHLLHQLAELSAASPTPFEAVSDLTAGNASGWLDVVMNGQVADLAGKGPLSVATGVTAGQHEPVELQGELVELLTELQRWKK